MTSGNLSEEPIAYRDDDARERLAGVADGFLLHDRPIHTRTDDSVARVIELACRPQTSFIRRSRGYVPGSLPLPGAGATVPLLACGAELKNTFCVARDNRAWVSHHIGDLENYETLRSFTEGIDHFERLFDVVPRVVAHDLHPEYLSTKYALARDGLELVGVQHHHAHLAACLAEHGETGPAIGAIFDGTGYGTDGTIWGGEILHGSLTDFARVGSLLPVRLPGGSRGVREPWRMACAWLAAAGATIAPPLAEPRRWRAVERLIETGTASPWTTSMGRLFDAVAALCGIRTTVNYEGQAAIELEASCDPHERGRYPIVVTDGLVVDPRETVRADRRRSAARRSAPRRSPPAFTPRSPRPPSRPARAPPAPPEPRRSCSPAGCSSTAACSGRPPRDWPPPVSGRSYLSGCPPTTAGSPMGRPRSRPLGWRRDARCARALRLTGDSGDRWP